MEKVVLSQKIQEAVNKKIHKNKEKVKSFFDMK